MANYKLVLTAFPCNDANCKLPGFHCLQCAYKALRDLHNDLTVDIEDALPNDDEAPEEVLNFMEEALEDAEAFMVAYDMEVE